MHKVTGRGTAMPMRTGPVKTLLMSTAASAVLMAGGAFAQDVTETVVAPADDATTVVVTGIKRSLQDSIALKRRSNSIVEVVSAEDIGKLPDLSIAESLARLPGLTAQRVNGRAQTISIRGLSPDFSNTLLNGRLQVSTGDNRAAEFDQYPSELINRAVVYKTPDAGLIGQGLSGTVDLGTVHPLDLKQRVISVNLRGSFNSNKNANGGSTNGNRFSIAYIDQFMDGKLGFAFGYAHLDDPTAVRHFKYWGWEQSNPNVEWGSAPVNSQTQFDAAHKDAWRLSGFEAENVTRTQVRDGAIAIVEFKPTDNFTSTNDYYYSKFDQGETMHGLMGSLGVWGGTDPESNRPHYTNPGFTPIPGAPAATDGSDMVNTSGTISNILLINRNDFNGRQDVMSQFGTNNKLTLGGWSLVLDASVASAKRKESIMEQYMGVAPFPTLGSLTYEIPTDLGDGPMQFSSSIDYNNPALMAIGDVAGWGADGHIRYPVVNDSISQAKFTAQHELSFGPISSIDLGVGYSRRVKSKTVDEFDLCLNGSTPNCNSTSMAIPSGLQTTSSDFSWLGLGDVVAVDPVKALNTIYTLKPIQDENHYNKYWKVAEGLLTSYIKADINTSLFGMPVRGNVGVQVVDAKQTSNGFVTQNGDNGVQFVWYDKTVDYSNVLPSLNLVANVTDNTLVHLGAGRAMARPRMDDMRANASAGLAPISSSAGETKGTWSGSGGNPNLKPWLADAYDISVEHYFSKRSYVAIAYFSKKLLNYIYNNTVFDYDFTGYPNIPRADGTSLTPVTKLEDGTYVAGNLGTFTRPENGQGGKISGIELSASLEGGLLSHYLDGFGIQASLSKPWTNIHPDGPGTSNKLPGYSSTNSNVTVYYEKMGFSARISERYRSADRGEVVQLFATRGYTLINPDKQIDAQVSYEFQTGSVKGLTLLLQANNLTDSPYSTSLGGGFPGGALQPEVYETYGRQILLGASMKF